MQGRDDIEYSCLFCLVNSHLSYRVQLLDVPVREEANTLVCLSDTPVRDESETKSTTTPTNVLPPSRAITLLDGNVVAERQRQRVLVVSIGNVLLNDDRAAELLAYRPLIQYEAKHH